MPELLGPLVFCILLLGGTAWFRVFSRWSSGQPALAWQPRRHVPWGLLDLVAAVVLLVLGIVAALLLLRELGLLPEPVKDALPTLAALRMATAAEAVAKLAVLLVMVLLLMLRTRTTLSDLGWSGKHLLEDIRLGAIAFAMFAPLVLALQAALVQFYPSKHPLIEMLKEHRDVNLFAVVAFSAAVAAPLAEEFLFRVLLQGWLEKAFTFRGPTPELVVGAPAARPVEEAEADVLAPQPRGYRALAPILVSSFIFALLHWSHGPDWVPLTVLALGLGYLYQRTHRLVPSLTVHALLNGFTVLILWFELFGQAAAP